MSYNNRGNMNRNTNNRRSNDFGGAGNRRTGGGGAAGNYFDNYSRPLNPWEGGMVPGRSGNSSMGQGDLLSQLTSPEAQLALASNLINKLINQQQSVPSLLNIGNMNSGGGMSSFNDNFGNTRNFQDRRRGRMDQRRTEPYNKSGMNRRGGGNDRRYPNQNLGNKNRAGTDRKNSLFSPKKEDKDKKDKDAEKTNGDIKTESTDDSQRNEDGEKEDSQNSEPEEKCLPIPPALLYCHVCSKNMWDEPSFSNHLKGRPHMMMMDGLSEKYKLKVDLLRHDMRLTEQQREMEMERKERQGVKTFNRSREFCAMCDLSFFGHLVSHRKNIRHQKLKAFLHPKCSHCDKEFSTRLEWDDHRLTFAHLRKVAEFRRINKPDIKDDEFDIDELICPENVNCGEMVSKEVPVMNLNLNEDDTTIELKEETLKEKDDLKKEAKEGEEGKEDGAGDENKEKEADVPQNIDVDPSALPKYNQQVAIGKEMVVPVSGFLCRVCNRFIKDNVEQEIHCRTLYHYNNFCAVVRAKARVSSRKYKDAKDGKKTEEAKGDDSKAEAGDDEGNWKRRKTGDKTEDKMDVDDIKEEGDGKTELSESVWEEGDKDSEEVKEEPAEEEVDEETSSPTKRAGRGGRAAPRGRRGGRRGK